MKSINKTLLVCAMVVGAASTARAIPVVSIVPSAASVTEGASTSVDVVVSGLEDEFIGDYDLTLAWDPTLLSLASVTFDTYLDGPADSINGFDSTPASVNVFEVSLGGLSNQFGLSGFRLFSLDLLALNEGLAALSLDAGTGLLGNEFGEAYQAWGVVNANLEIIANTPPPPTSVPEPSTVALLMCGLTGLLSSRWRRHRAAMHLI